MKVNAIITVKKKKFNIVIIFTSLFTIYHYKIYIFHEKNIY